MSLTQQFYLLKRLCHSIDACCKINSPPVHAPATAAALRHALKSIAESLLDQRLKGRVFSFEALHLLLDACMGSQLLLQRCCHAGQGFSEASTAHIFIKIAPILYSRLAAAAAMLHVVLPNWDVNVQLSDFAAQISAIKASGGSTADEACNARCMLFAGMLERLHSEPCSPAVPGELLSLSMIRNSLGAPIGPVTIGRGKHSSVLGCTIGLLPAALKDLTSVEPDLLRRAAQPRSMIQSLASVLHPHISHIYGVLEAEGVSGVVSCHVPGCPLSDLPVHRIHIQVRQDPLISEPAPSPHAFFEFHPRLQHALLICLCVARGLFTLHSCKPPSCHGNLHPHNIIVDGVKLIGDACPAALLLRMSAAGLPKMDFIGHCDAYVRVCVEDDAGTHEIARTAAVTNSAAPHWEAISIPWQRLPNGKGTVLTLGVYDRDLTDEDDFIGGVRVSVEDALAAGSSDVGYAIASRGDASQSGAGLGTLFFKSKAFEGHIAELSVASDIQYVSQFRSGKVDDALPQPSVCITGFSSSRNAHYDSAAGDTEDALDLEPIELLLRMSAAGLPKMDFIGHCDAYVRVCVEDDAGTHEIARTAAVTNSAAPHWEAISIPWQRLPNGKGTVLTLGVYDRDLTDEDDFIGDVRVSVEDALAAGSSDVGYAIASRGDASQSGAGLGTLFFKSKLSNSNHPSAFVPSEIKNMPIRGKHNAVPSISPLFEIANESTINAAVAADIRALHKMIQMFAESSNELCTLLKPALLACDNISHTGDSPSHNNATLGVIQAIESALGWQKGAEGEDVASLVHYVHEGLDSKGDAAVAGHSSIHTVAALLSEAVRLLTDMARFGPQHHREAVCCRSAAAAFVRLAGTDISQHAHPAIFSLCELVLHFGGAATVDILSVDGLHVLVHTTLHHTSELGMKASQALGALVKANDECRAAVLKAGAVQALLSSVKSGVDELVLSAAASQQSLTIGAQVTSSMAALRQLCEFPTFQRHIVDDGGVGTLVNIFNGIMRSDAISHADRTMLLGDAAFVAAILALVPSFRLQLIDAGIVPSMMNSLAARKFLAGEWRKWTGAAIASLSVETQCHHTMLQHHVPHLMHVLLSETQIEEVVSAVRCCNNLLLATASASSALLSARVATLLVDALPELHNRPGDTATIECNLSALRILCEADAKSVYDATGAIATLKMVAESTSHCLSQASDVDIAFVLSSIAALSDRAREEIGASGFIAWLFKRLSGPPCTTREWSMVACASLASNVTCMAVLKEAGGVDLFLMLLHSPSLLEVELAAAALCNIVAELDPAVEGIILNAKGVEKLTNLAREAGTNAIVTNCVGALWSLCSSSSAIRNELLLCNTIQVFCFLADCGSQDQQAMSLSALRACCVQHSMLQPIILADGLTVCVSAMNQRTTSSTAADAAFVLSELACIDSCREVICSAGGVPLLVNEACAGFTFPSQEQDDDEDGKQDVEPKLRVLPMDVDARADISVRKIAVKALANLAWKACNQQAIVDCGGLKPLVALLSHGDDNEREYAAVALCNLCAGPASCVIRNRTSLAMLGGIKPLQLLNRAGRTDGQRSTSGRVLALLSDSGFDVTAPKV